MKLLFSCLSAAALGASWPGQSWGDGRISNCGTQVQLTNNIVNGSCTINLGGFTPAHISIAGCFTQGTGLTNIECYGVDGVTNAENLDVVIFWDQAEDADGNLDNSTCGTEADVTAINCVDNGHEPSQPMFDNISNNFHTGETLMNYNVQIFGAAGSESYTLDMKDMNGLSADVKNVTCGYCTSATFSGSTIMLDVNKDAYKSTLINLQVETDSQLSPHTSTITVT